MSSAFPDSAAKATSRICVLLVLIAAPLAFGAVHDWARWPFFWLCSTAGVVSWARARWARSRGEIVAAVPGRWLLLCFHAVVVCQVIRVPAPLLGLVSPGSLAFYWWHLDATDIYWLPITASLRTTQRGLVYLIAVSLLYAAVFRDFAERRWARRLSGVVVGMAVFMTLIALVQKASSDPGNIYGLWKPVYSHAVFGPYANRSHYSGYAVMAVPLALAFAVEGWSLLRESWRRRGFHSLGEPEVSALPFGVCVSVFVVVGILNSGSRTGIGVLAFTAIAVPFMLFRRSMISALLVVASVAAAGYAWSDLSWLSQTFGARGFEASRFVVWRDMWPMVGDFPLMGAGLNALGRAYRSYQTVYKWDLWSEAHNEYYQTLLDTGILGAGLALAMIALLFSRAIRAAGRGAFQAGLAGALLAQAAANCFDFNWQIPANAATFAALAAVTLAREDAARGQAQAAE